jgi:hypothetical protein
MIKIRRFLDPSPDGAVSMSIGALSGWFASREEEKS